MLKYLFLILFSLNAYAEVSEGDLVEFHKSLRCLVCEGQSVYDSNAEFANDIKEQTDLMLKDGKNLKQIEQFYIDIYGESILFAPKLNFSNLVVWVLPYVFIIGFGFYFFRRK